MEVFVYRNRSDDDRTRDELYFCYSCCGWYGVPHNDSHCQEQMTARYRPEDCACRFCRYATGQPIEGFFGFWTKDEEWEP